MIAASILVGAFLVSGSSSSATTSNKEAHVSTTKSVFTIDDLADYLSVSTEDIEKVVRKDALEKAAIKEGIYDTYTYIPYATISGEKRFLRSEIDQWLEYQSLNK